MTDEEIKEAINNMSEQELNEYIFFALQEMTQKCEKQQAEIEKKDKVIDFMAKYIARFDIEEDICNKVEDNCYDYAGQNGKLCEECIKEYFKNKVETEEK